MAWLLGSLLLLMVSGVLSALLRGNARARVGAAGAVAACALGLVPAWRGLAGGEALFLTRSWMPPFGSFSLAVGPVNALFLAIIFALGLLCAVYGFRYMKSSCPALHWFFYNLLLASMALVVTAQNGLLFMVAWEMMSLASFFLVMTDSSHASVRSAGTTYLIAAHLGGACLVLMFCLMGSALGTLDFWRLGEIATLHPGLADTLFVLGLLGFGTKAGFMPLHVWLPEAHPAAPSHVSALMSGVMIKTGIYGLICLLAWLGPPPAWWGWTLICIGATSGILGLLLALAQHDLKRLLAYCSVENIGIIALGLGMGLLGRHYHSAALIALGWCGALFHIVNHAVFKSLLFLGAGAVAQETGTRIMDELGGLMKKMPVTGTAVLVGAAAISGLPPFSGFAGELLIYLSAFQAISSPAAPAGAVLAGLAVLAALALIGGLAAACFTKAFGVVFLGEPRTRKTELAREPGPAMAVPMVALASACLLLAVASPLVLGGLFPVVRSLAPADFARETPGLAMGMTALRMTAFAAAGLLLFSGLAWLLRSLLTARRPARRDVTWDCGYALPTARMQYTAASFAQPFLRMFRTMVRPHEHLPLLKSLFPPATAFSSHTPDFFSGALFAPLSRWFARGMRSIKPLQHGGVHWYVIYIVVALVALLIWNLT